MTTSLIIDLKLLANIPIKNRSLLTTALTHRSWLNENQEENIESNERLEFLGDAVLELVISEYLFHKYPQYKEGNLTALRASLVKTETLAQVAKTLHLGEALLLSKGEEQGGGRDNQSLLADTFEAVIGAIFLESGKISVTKFLKKTLIPQLKKIIANHLEKDAKSQLQEKVQAEGNETPTYKLIKQEGPDHNKTFTVAVVINGKQISKGVGKSKQQAQQTAAQLALEKLYRN